MGKTTLAKSLAIHCHYNYINAEVFFNNHGVTECTQKVKVLGDFMASNSNKNFVLDNFPQTKKQAKIFVDTYSSPLAVFNIKATKDEVYDKIE